MRFSPTETRPKSEIGAISGRRDVLYVPRVKTSLFLGPYEDLRGLGVAGPLSFSANECVYYSDCRLGRAGTARDAAPADVHALVLELALEPRRILAGTALGTTQPQTRGRIEGSEIKDQRWRFRVQSSGVEVQGSGLRSARVFGLIGRSAPARAGSGTAPHQGLMLR